jgi:hypothetical protein
MHLNIVRCLKLCIVVSTTTLPTPLPDGVSCHPSGIGPSTLGRQHRQHIRAMMGAAREEFGHLGEALVTRIIDEMMRQMHEAMPHIVQVIPPREEMH